MGINTVGGSYYNVTINDLVAKASCSRMLKIN